MSKPSLLGAVAGTALLLPAQSPCVPPSSFQTLFAGTTYLGTPDPVVGANMLFDLAVSGNVVISQIDVNTYDDGSVTTNPILVGQTTSLVVWIVPTTWVGNNTSQSLWTQLATGTLTIATANQHSPAVFNPPFVLPTGTWGVALQHLPVTTGTATGPVHPLYTNPAVQPTPTVVSDQFLTLTAGAGQNVAFVSGVAQPRVVNTQIHYTPATGSGWSAQFGQGCYNRPTSFYEHFTVPPAAFDLSGSTVTLIDTGSAYTVIQGAPGLFAANPANVVLNASNAPLGDDDISAPITLPFTFPYPGGGNSTQIQVGSNGYVFLQGSTVTGPFYGGISGLLTAAPRHCPFWGDTDPSAGGSVLYDVDPSGQTVYVTWLNVPEWNVPTSSNTFQVALQSSGLVEYRYGACAISAAAVLTGWSPGNGAVDPGSMDISASLPFVTGDGSLPPVLAMSSRPVTGTSPQLTTSNLRPGTTAGILVLGFGALLPGIDLGFLGMPGCRQFINPATTFFFLVSGPSAGVNVGIPNNPGLGGLQVTGQSAVFSPGLNTAGILVSNGICLTVGVR